MTVALRAALLAPLVALPSPAFAGRVEDRALIGQLDREVIALRQRIGVLEERLATCDHAGDPDPIYQELVQVFAGQPVAVTREGRATVVLLPADLVFASASVALRDEGQFAVDLLATALKLHPDMRVVIVGHTDAEPPTAAMRKHFPTNWELSMARAATLARDLIEGYGVSPHRFTVAGRGAQEPIATNDTPEGRAQNRRVAVHISPGGP